MKKRLLTICVIMALSGTSSFAHAVAPLQQEDDFNDDYLDDEFGDDQFGDFYGSEEFISIATGTQQTIDKAPAVASVITAEQIKQSGARNLMEALSMVPGLHISRSSQAMAPKFNFRGITSTYTPQTLLMLNGVPTTSTVRGDNQIVWGEYPVKGISRIEIIRGPGSALYGADAFAGVINIITKSADDILNTELGAGAGSFDTQNGWFNSSFTQGEFKAGFSIEYLSSDGSDETIEQDAQTPLDALAQQLFELPPVSLAPGQTQLSFESLDISLNAEYEAFKISLSHQERSDVGTGQGIADALDTSGRFSGIKQMFDVVHETDTLASNWKFRSHFNYFKSSQEVEEDIVLLPPGTLFGSFPQGVIGNPGYKEDATTIEFRGDYSGKENHLFTVGVGYKEQDLYEVTESKNFFPDLSPNPAGLVDVTDTPEIFIPEFDRNDKFIFIQDIWKIAPDWELTSGLRYDDYSDFGSTINPRVSLVWSTSLKSTTKFLYGRAFRAPSFAELLTVNNPVTLGNPNIEPETIDSIEIAYSYRHSDKHTSSINIFHYTIDDFITFVPDDGAPTATAQNVGERTGFGLEAETGFNVQENISIKANYSFVKAEDDLVNDEVGDYPNHQLKAEMLWQINSNWSLLTSAHFIGERERSHFDQREALDGYSDLGIHLYYENNDGWHLSLAVNNLLDEDIREPSVGPSTEGGSVNIPNDLPLAGVNFMFRVSKSL